MSVGTLQRWAKEGVVSPAIRLPGGRYRWDIEDLRRQLQPKPREEFGPQPIVAVIVTSAAGVLLGKRQDGIPPWTFIAGEVEPEENPTDAAIREVKEETGLEVRIGPYIGTRVHPATGRLMLYTAAYPVEGTDVFVGDQAELSEVRWVTLAEARKLMPTMFGPVQRWLERELAA